MEPPFPMVTWIARDKGAQESEHTPEENSGCHQILSGVSVKGKCQSQHQEEEVVSTREQMLKVEEGMDPEVNKSSQLNQVRKEMVKEMCQLGKGRGVQAVAQLRRPAGTSTEQEPSSQLVQPSQLVFSESY